VERLCQLGVLEKLPASEWALPSFIIPKKDKTVCFLKYGACMGGSKTLKKYIFKSFFDDLKLSSGHCSNEYKCNTTTTPP
jgi:hypothetical protein